MDHFRRYKSVPVNVYIRDVLSNDKWELGIWEYTENRPVWGLKTDGRETHMCYSMNYAKPQEAVEKVREFGRYYFDAGGNGRPVYMTVEDLEQGFKDLGVWDV